MKLSRLWLGAALAGLIATASHAQAVQIIGAQHQQTSVLATSLTIANSARRKLQSFEVNADSTLSGAAWWLLIYDAAADPGNGAVTPAKCYGVPSGTTQMGATFDSAGPTMGVGLVLVVSTTGCFTETQSAHAFIAVDYQ